MLLPDKYTQVGQNKLYRELPLECVMKTLAKKYQFGGTECCVLGSLFFTIHYIPSRVQVFWARTALMNNSTSRNTNTDWAVN